MLYTDACNMRNRQEDLGLCEDTGLQPHEDER